MTITPRPLVVRAADLMTDPIIWERMKRVLRERRIGAEDPLGPLGLYATTLRPVPVPIRVRVVLVGPPDLYATLLEADPDFAALFRVKVEIEPSIPRTTENLRALDASGAAGIAVMPVPHVGLGEAINDRLKRAAAPKR